MSGGVDSSVAAGRLVEAGHDVVGATLRLWGGESDSGCCSVADVDDARRVAQVLGIDHHVFNYSEEFERDVVAPFVAGHAIATTPNPCIECNRKIKFDLLFERAARLGFDAVATGHHARVEHRDTEHVLMRGLDPLKDQSYVLGYLTADTLARLALPIGELDKAEVRSDAQRFGLRTWDKPDSQDVCFIDSTRGRAGFLASRIALTAADIVDTHSGEVVASTDAAELMTVGQRRGLPAGRDGSRRYVSRVDLVARRVEVAPLESVMTTTLTLEGSSITFARSPLADGSVVEVQVSAHGRPQGAVLRLDENPRVELDTAIRPVAHGQSVVFYRASEPDVVEGAAIVTRLHAS